MKFKLPKLGTAALAVLLVSPVALADRPSDLSTPNHNSERPRAKRDSCVRVLGNATTEAIADNVFVGTIDDMQWGGAHRPAWVTQTLTNVRITNDGAIKATATTVYEFEGNNDGVCDEGETCFETTDQVRVAGDDDEGVEGGDAGATEEEADTGFSALNALSRVSAGFGDMDGACGTMTLHGALDFTADPTSSIWRVMGRVCDCE